MSLLTHLTHYTIHDIIHYPAHSLIHTQARTHRRCETGRCRGQAADAPRATYSSLDILRFNCTDDAEPRHADDTEEHTESGDSPEDTPGGRARPIDNELLSDD